jgi:hypothetical protein
MRRLDLLNELVIFQIRMQARVSCLYDRVDAELERQKLCVLRFIVSHLKEDEDAGVFEEPEANDILWSWILEKYPEVQPVKTWRDG